MLTMAITISSETYDEVRRTWNIQIDSPHNSLPSITVNRETLWLSHSDSTKVIKQLREDTDFMSFSALDPEFNLPVSQLCAALGLNPSSTSLMQVVSAMADYLEVQAQQAQPPA